MTVSPQSFQATLETALEHPVSEEDALESWRNLSGFLSTLIEINSETKVMKPCK